METVTAAQGGLVAGFEAFEPAARFVSHRWSRPEGGGGQARVLGGGAVFAKVAVNVSAVSGDQVPESLASRHPGTEGRSFFATGLSLIAHAVNPYVPSFHANYRYFEVEGGKTWWFGGGADLTPNYGFEDDARHFHGVLQRQCAAYEPGLYDRLKRRCDDYFKLPHRDETRGVGGIFFDRLSGQGADHEPVAQAATANVAGAEVDDQDEVAGASPTDDRHVGGAAWRRDLAFVTSGLAALGEAYFPLVNRRRGTPYEQRQLDWQAHRRGRYVEFNLLYDRGTLFGLQTGGNVEAILASLPPTAAWSFSHAPEPGSEESRLTEFLRPRDWLGATPHGSSAAAGADPHTTIKEYR